MYCFLPAVLHSHIAALLSRSEPLVPLQTVLPAEMSLPHCCTFGIILLHVPHTARAAVLFPRCLPPPGHAAPGRSMSRSVPFPVRLSHPLTPALHFLYLSANRITLFANSLSEAPAFYDSVLMPCRPAPKNPVHRKVLHSHCGGFCGFPSILHNPAGVIPCFPTILRVFSLHRKVLCADRRIRLSDHHTPAAGFHIPFSLRHMPAPSGHKRINNENTVLSLLAFFLSILHRTASARPSVPAAPAEFSDLTPAVFPAVPVILRCHNKVSCERNSCSLSQIPSDSQAPAFLHSTLRPPYTHRIWTLSILLLLHPPS